MSTLQPTGAGRDEPPGTPRLALLDGVFHCPMPSKWPTLEGRLAHPLRTPGEALVQLAATIPLSDAGRRALARAARRKKTSAVIYRPQNRDAS